MKHAQEGPQDERTSKSLGWEGLFFMPCSSILLYSFMSVEVGFIEDFFFSVKFVKARHDIVHIYMYVKS